MSGTTQSGSPLWNLVLAFVVGLVGFVLSVPVAVVLVVAVSLLGIETSALVLVVLSLISLQGIAFPITAYLYLLWRGFSTSFLRISTPSARDLLWAGGGALLAFALAFGAAIAISLVDLPTAQRSDRELLLGNPEVLLVLIPLSFLLIGPGEELLFRGVIQGTLRRSFGAPAAIVLANLAFAPAHIVSLTGSLSGLAVTIGILFLPGLVFGYLYEVTDNLTVPVLAHGLYDAVLFALVYLGLRAGAGGETVLFVL